MQFCQSLAPLFTSALSGRKLSSRRRGGADNPLTPGASGAAEEAAIYVRGLLEAGAGERNLEDIAATVPGGDHQRVHHFVSNVPWDEAKVLDWVSARADGLPGGTPQSFLIADESGFTKKGSASAAVAHQYNGRLGKTDNCQVGVFTALAAGSRVTLLEGRLYLPEAWADDPGRCEKAKIPPEKRTFKSKAQIAREMIRAQRQRGVRFAWTSLDAGYGKDPALLRGLDTDGEIFVAGIHANQRLWTTHPWPAVPQTIPGSTRGKPVSRLRPAQPGQEVRAWAAAQPADHWQPFKRREGQNGLLRGSFLHARVWRV
jgi:SRSO17 transposase